MSKTFEICFEDLNSDAQERYKEIAGDDVNEFIPLAILEIEDETDNS